MSLFYSHETTESRTATHRTNQWDPTLPEAARRPPFPVLNSINLSQEPVMLLTVFCSPAYQTCYFHTIMAPSTALLRTRVQGEQVPVQFSPADRKADFLQSPRLLSWLQYVPRFLKTHQLFQRNMKLTRRMCRFIHNIFSSTNTQHRLELTFKMTHTQYKPQKKLPSYSLFQLGKLSLHTQCQAKMFVKIILGFLPLQTNSSGRYFN